MTLLQEKNAISRLEKRGYKVERVGLDHRRYWLTTYKERKLVNPYAMVQESLEGLV